MSSAMIVIIRVIWWHNDTMEQHLRTTRMPSFFVPTFRFAFPQIPSLKNHITQTGDQRRRRQKCVFEWRKERGYPSNLLYFASMVGATFDIWPFLNRPSAADWSIDGSSINEKHHWCWGLYSNCSSSTLHDAKPSSNELRTVAGARYGAHGKATTRAFHSKYLKPQFSRAYTETKVPSATCRLRLVTTCIVGNLFLGSESVE